MIFKASDIPESISTNVHCTYRLPMVSEDQFATAKVPQTTTVPEFNYSLKHKLVVTKTAAEELLSHALAIAVFGDITQERRKQELDKLKDQSKERNLKTLIGSPGFNDVPFGITPTTSSKVDEFHRRGTFKAATEGQERRVIDQLAALEKEKARC
jgi:hypothetical protein